MSIERPDYRIYMNDDTWTLNDAINVVFSEQEYLYCNSDAINKVEINLNARKQEITDVLKNKVSIFVIGKTAFEDIYDDDGDPIIDEYGLIERDVDIFNTHVDIKKFIKYVLNQKGVFPKELYDWYLQKSGCIKPDPETVREEGDNNSHDGVIEHEDIISDETILKLMELPLPKMKQQVAMLAAEKKKTDAAVMAAAKIGLLFYEESLQKPANEKLFVTEYKKYLDKFPALPDTTIRRIYKNLPEGYRTPRDGGKISTDQADIRPMIKAAAFAGSMAHERDSMNVVALKKSLSLEQYAIPSDDILKEIIAAVKNLELDVDE